MMLPLHHHDMRERVLGLESQWRQAQLSNDVPTMERMLADDYIGVSPAGIMSTKAQTLSRASSHESVFHKLEFADQHVKLVGNVAIVTSRATVDATMEGHSLRGQFLYTRVYRRLQNGTWKITSFEATPVTGTLKS